MSPFHKILVFLKLLDSGLSETGPTDDEVEKAFGSLDHAISHFVMKYCQNHASKKGTYSLLPSEAKTGGTSLCPRSNARKLLQNLEPYEEINVLILGESGVGKSTFINALINYIYFPSLDQALETERLHHLIPFSFATQIPDTSDPQGRIIQKTVRFGSSSDEHDGSKGQSATQKTQVYSLTFSSTIVRLIDTPGIGDVRGVEQDKRNMADILSVLRGYTHIHGILVLLKPNNCRLGVMFKFCIKELLTHLHRSAAQNMVFGFTNTRGSNYQPGDTFKPLEVLLKEFDSVNIGLYKSTVYCFDSESFRYLAARKRDIKIGDQSDYDRSWERSTIEARRLLGHFKSLQPHQVKSTMNLNETRNIIAQLTKPMALMAQDIKASIAISEDKLADPGLIFCYCIIQDGPKKGICQFCTHSWQEHLHIRYELKHATSMVIDTYVKQELLQNANDIQIQERLINSKQRIIKEFEQEHRTIKEAAIHFTLFLRRHSITPYNDAAVEYLDFLIKDEKAKVQLGGRRARLDGLERYRSEHLEMVEILSQNIDHGRQQILDEAGIERLVHQLYGLKHYGKSLQDIRNVIDDAGSASFREKPYRVGGFHVTEWAGAIHSKRIQPIRVKKATHMGQMQSTSNELRNHTIAQSIYHAPTPPTQYLSSNIALGQNSLGVDMRSTETEETAFTTDDTPQFRTSQALSTRDFMLASRIIYDAGMNKVIWDSFIEYAKYATAAHDAR
ncbi:hypothetical protein GQ44DRAFT_767855 [Phaeosphaeriaceae sp. PMI808]|nr:hypothetical protein GQ44DRAFT_767855 [Phaeosphaeriaceae sp. PMI808]